MTEYQVLANGTKEFQLLANSEVLGHLRYTEWFSFKAEVSLADGSSFQVEPRGFWGTTIELKNHDVVLLSFKMHWNGDIIIKSRLDDHGQAFVFKTKSLLKHTYTLQDKKGQELLVVQPNMEWNKLNYNYTISATEHFDAVESQAVLLLMAIHCANYCMTMLASTTALLLAT